jgi:hypothetical protein
MHTVYLRIYCSFMYSPLYKYMCFWCTLLIYVCIYVCVVHSCIYPCINTCVSDAHCLLHMFRSYMYVPLSVSIFDSDVHCLPTVLFIHVSTYQHMCIHIALISCIYAPTDIVPISCIYSPTHVHTYRLRILGIQVPTHAHTCSLAGAQNPKRNTAAGHGRVRCLYGWNEQNAVPYYSQGPRECSFACLCAHVCLRVCVYIYIYI